MKNEWLSALSRVATIHLALESLRDNDRDRALELLERDLDASVLGLSLLSKEVSGAQGECVIKTLKQIRDYRRAHPRRCEADLKIPLPSGVELAVLFIFRHAICNLGLWQASYKSFCRFNHKAAPVSRCGFHILRVLRATTNLNQ
jgi:hypothetical protein